MESALDRVPLRFASPAECEVAQQEQVRLKALPAVLSDFVGPTLLQWARENPDDPEVPKTLHELVARTKGECGYGSGRSDPKLHISRSAFELLHRRYANNPWARKTPYHY